MNNKDSICPINSSSAVALIIVFQYSRKTNALQLLILMVNAPYKQNADRRIDGYQAYDKKSSKFRPCVNNSCCANDPLLRVFSSQVFEEAALHLPDERVPRVLPQNTQHPPGAAHGLLRRSVTSSRNNSYLRRNIFCQQ